MIQSGVKERLRRFIEHCGVSETTFEVECGMANRYVENIRQSVSPKKVQNIIRIYPELNVDWLITGRGSMTLGPKEMLPQDMQSIYEKEILLRDKKIDSLQRELDRMNGDRLI